jgi:hypothetical protein
LGPKIRCLKLFRNRSSEEKLFATEAPRNVPDSQKPKKNPKSLGKVAEKGWVLVEDFPEGLASASKRLAKDENIKGNGLRHSFCRKKVKFWLMRVPGAKNLEQLNCALRKPWNRLHGSFLHRIAIESWVEKIKSIFPYASSLKIFQTLPPQFCLL